MVSKQLTLEITQTAILLVLIDINSSGRRPCGHHCERPAEKAAILLLVIGVVVNPGTGIDVGVAIAIVEEHWNMGVSEDHYAGIALGIVD